MRAAAICPAFLVDLDDADFEGLDQQVQALVNRPIPARLDEDFPACRPTTVPRQNRTAASVRLRPVDEVFGDVFPELMGQRCLRRRRFDGSPIPRPSAT